MDQVRAQGTTNYAAIRPSNVLNYEIPLPPLEEQRRIVARIEELATKIEEARGLRREAKEETEILLRQAHKVLWEAAGGEAPTANLLEAVADVLDPQPDHRTPAEVIGGMPYVSIANISINGDIDTNAARKVSPFAIERQEAAFTLQTGDIVLGKIGTVGAARPIIVKGRFALSANVVLVKPDRSKIHEKLLLILLRSPQAEEQFVGGTRTSAQGAFGIKKMRKLSIPVPSLEKQTQLINYFEYLQSRVNTLNRMQAESSAELNALLPSILDRAFKGEL